MPTPLQWTLAIESGPPQPIGQFATDGLLSYRAGGQDTLRLTARGSRFDSTLSIPYDGNVTLRSPDGEIRFYGSRKSVPLQAEARSESYTMLFKGPWAWLEELVYHRVWNFNIITGVAPNQTVTPITESTSECYLNYDPDTNLLTSVGQQIQDVIEYAISQGAPIQVGTINIPTTPLMTLVNDMTCAAVIQNMLIWAPDAVPFFDYRTTPPTFNVLRRSQLDEATLDILTLNSAAAIEAGEGPFICGIQVTRLDEQVVPAVALRYRYTNSVNGRTYITRDYDAYPLNVTGRERRALAKTIDLAGREITQTSATIESVEIPATGLAFARELFPWLDAGILDGSISASSVTISRTTIDGDPGTLPNRIISGSPAPWMPIDYIKEKVKVTISYVRTDPTLGQVAEVVHEDTQEFISTDADLGEQTYTTVTDFTASDPTPVGLAQYLYESLNTVEHDGSIRLEGVTNSFLVGMGSAVNIAGCADASLATMQAIPQQIDHEIRSGKAITHVSFAPGQVLGLDRILELLRAYRSPRKRVTAEAINDGELTGAGNSQVEFAEQPQLENTIPGPKTFKQFAVVNSTGKIDLNATTPSATVSQAAVTSVTSPGREVHTNGTKIVDINTADITGTAKFRDTNICVLVGSTPTTFTVKMLRTAYTGEV